jgi:hypothetical protein
MGVVERPGEGTESGSRRRCARHCEARQRLYARAAGLSRLMLSNEALATRARPSEQRQQSRLESAEGGGVCKEQLDLQAQGRWRPPASAAISFSGLTATKILVHGHQSSGLVAMRIPV